MAVMTCQPQATSFSGDFCNNKIIKYLIQNFHCIINHVLCSNGLLDPWSSGGVMRNLSQTAIAVIIPEGAHHLDLRASNTNDPVSVVQARKVERHAIRRWIKGHHKKLRRSERQWLLYLSGWSKSIFFFIDKNNFFIHEYIYIFTLCTNKYCINK